MSLKLFKNLPLILVSLFALSACNKEIQTVYVPFAQPETPKDKTDPFEEEEDGGISAGGGGTLPADPISVHDVVEVVDSAKRTLRLFFNYVRQYNHSDLKLESYKYFFGPENVASVLEKTDIEILQDKACKNKLGKDVDASVHASRPNTICISAFRIAPKLIEENANKEILALLVHELSHFLGSTEKEAQELQRLVAWKLQSMSSIRLGELENQLWQAPMMIESLPSLADSIKELKDGADLKSIRDDLVKTEKGLADFENYFGQSTQLRFTDYHINEFERIIFTRIRLATWFVESMDANYPNQEDSKELYEKCFAGKTEITAAEIDDTCPVYIGKENLYLEYKFRKMQSLDDLSSGLKDVIVYVRNLGSHARAISFNQPLPYFHLPSQKEELNPWLNFVGKYEVINKSCASNYDNNWNGFSYLEQFEISEGLDHYPVPNQIVAMIMEKGGGMTSWSPYSNGSGNYSMKVSGDANIAQMSQERGTRWYDRQGHGWTKTTKSIEKSTATVNGKSEITLKLKMKSEYFLYNHRGISEASHNCDFDLRKVD